MQNLLEKKSTYNVQSLKEELIRLIVISFGIFLFILFFQPFPLEQLAFENRLLYVTGFGAILFVTALLVLILLPLVLPNWFKISLWEDTPPAMLSFFLFLISSTAFAFYIRFVGKTPLSLYVLFKIILVCILPVGVLWVLYRMRVQEITISLLRQQIRQLSANEQREDNNADKEPITFSSGVRSDLLQLPAKDIISLQSSDNYVEIRYISGNGKPDKKLVRNTLKAIEKMLRGKARFVRCHRSSIINTRHIEKMFRRYGMYYLKMNNLEETIPVSRPYVARIKQALSIP